MSEPDGRTQPLPVVARAQGHPGPPGPPGPGQSSAAGMHGPVPTLEQGGGGRSGRFWSARRVPAALVALVVLAGTGLLLYDIAAVRAGHSAMKWRRELADGLATRPLDDVWVLVGAGVLAALGLWLLLLAVTPGCARFCPCGVRPPTYGPDSTVPPPRRCCGTGPWRCPACSPHG